MVDGDGGATETNECVDEQKHAAEHANILLTHTS